MAKKNAKNVDAAPAEEVKKPRTYASVDELKARWQHKIDSQNKAIDKLEKKVKDLNANIAKRKELVMTYEKKRDNAGTRGPRTKKESPEALLVKTLIAQGKSIDELYAQFGIEKPVEE